MKKVLDIWPGDPELSKVMDELQELWQKTYSFGYLKIRMKKMEWAGGIKEIKRFLVRKIEPKFTGTWNHFASKYRHDRERSEKIWIFFFNLFFWKFLG